MEQCGFFDANLVGEEYDRVYLAKSFAAYFASFIGNGVFGGISDALQIQAQPTPNMQVIACSGQGWINGYWYENTDELSLTIDVADGTLNRIDSIVLRFGTAERAMWIEVHKGTAAVTPTAPALVRSADYYDLQLATVSIPAGAISITQARITDTRMNNEVCGWVTGLVDQIDTSTLFAQFETYFEEFKEYYESDYANWTDAKKADWLYWVSQQENDFTDWSEEQMDDFDSWYSSHTTQWQSEFDVWFAEVKGQLSEDVAGQLQLEIDTVNDELVGYSASTTTFSADGKTIEQIYEDGSKSITTFIDKFNILKEWYNVEGVKVKQKRTVFSSDGRTIEQIKEVV